MVLEKESEELASILGFLSLIRRGVIIKLDIFNQIAKRFGLKISPDDNFTVVEDGLSQIYTLDGRYVSVEFYIVINFIEFENETAMHIVCLDYYASRLMMTMNKIDWSYNTYGEQIAKEFKLH